MCPKLRTAIDEGLRRLDAEIVASSRVQVVSRTGIIANGRWRMHRNRNGTEDAR
jgi:hypothetical protein